MLLFIQTLQLMLCLFIQKDLKEVLFPMLIGMCVMQIQEQILGHKQLLLLQQEQNLFVL